MRKFLLNGIRVVAWIALTGFYWEIVFTLYRGGRAIPPFFVWIGALVLFAVCYLLMPRVTWLEGKP